jgi:hypothetical protein
MKHLLLLISIIILGSIFYFLYQHGIKIKAEESRKKTVSLKEMENRKNLQECLKKEDASIATSVKSNCAKNGVLPKTCVITNDEKKAIIDRVAENKEICRLKYTK